MPVEAPDGTAARPWAPPASVTSTSSVGLPRESRISRACIVLIRLSILGSWSRHYGRTMWHQFFAAVFYSHTAHGSIVGNAFRLRHGAHGARRRDQARSRLVRADPGLLYPECFSGRIESGMRRWHTSPNRRTPARGA